MNHSVEARATAELQRSMYPAVRRVRCNYDGRRLKLTGRMPSFFTKQVALRIVFQSLQHAITIDDQLEVAGT